MTGLQKKIWTDSQEHVYVPIALARLEFFCDAVTLESISYRTTAN